MKTGLKKMFRDMMLYKGRNLLTLTSILIGITSVGAVLSAYSILSREMNRNFMDTNPSSVVYIVPNLDDRAATLIKQYSPAMEIEFRKTIQARISRDDGTYGTIFLRAIPNFENQKVDTFTLEKGQFPATTSEMTIERDSLKILKNLDQGVGKSVQIKLPGGLEKELQLSGRVHAPGLAPASMENYSYGFISMDGLKALGYDGWFDEIRIVSYDSRFDFGKMKLLSGDIKKILEENNYVVSRLAVPIPGKHPHADQLNSLLFLLQAFTIITLLAACLIIINLMNFIMSKQVRQIAIMKAVGASTYDIAIPYLFYIIIVSVAALIISFPLSIAASNSYSNFAAGILNFNISSYDVPYWVSLMQVSVGILIPLASTVYPIYKSCIKSVKDGLFEKVDIGTSNKSKSLYFKNILTFTNSKFMIPVNNLLRKKTRTILAVLALVTGGVLYMTSLNIIVSIDKTVDASFQDFRWDYSITLMGNYEEQRLTEVLGSIDNLDKYEIGKGNTVFLKSLDNHDSVYCNVKIIPKNSQMVDIKIADGLNGINGTSTIIVNNGLVNDEKWIKPGMTIEAKINGKAADVVISKIVNEVPAIPTVYMDIDTFDKLFDGQSVQNILASASTRNINKQRIITKDIEEKFKTAGIEIVENWNIYLLRKSFTDHLLVIVTFLTAISWLAVVVGGLSIGSAIGMGVSERKREIGVLRAVGVNRRQLISIVLTEVFLMGTLSWIVGVIFSYPVSKWVGNYFGQIFLGTNLQNSMSLSGSVQWLIISVLVSMIAGFYPAWKSAMSPLREILAYE